MSHQTDHKSQAREEKKKARSKKEEEAYIAALQSADIEANEEGIRKYLQDRKFEAKKKRRRRLLVIAIILVVLDLIVIGLWHYIVHEQNTLEVTFYHLESDKVDSSFRIVQLSDLHLHEFGEKNAELVDWVRRLNPDIIVITGDMNIHFNEDTHVVTELCAQLREIANVYYVMGNHEWVDHIDRHTTIKKDIVATGVTMLENSYVGLEIDGNRVFIGGLVNEVSNYDKYSGPKFMEKFMAEDGFHLLLVHYDRLLLFLFASRNGEIDMQGPGSDPGLVLEEDLPFPVQVIDPRIYIIPGEHPFLEFFVCPSYRLSVHIAVPLVIISFIVSVKVVDVVGCIQASVSYNDHPCISIGCLEPLYNWTHMYLF